MSDRFIVESLDDWRWDPVTAFDDQSRAFDYAKYLERRRKFTRVRIVVETQSAGRPRRLVTYLGNERRKAPEATLEPSGSGWFPWKKTARGHRVVQDLAYATRIIAGTAIVLAVGAALITGLQVLN